LVKRLAAYNYGMNAVNRLNCYSIGWFHLSQVKSTDCTNKSTYWIHLWSR